MQKEEDWCVQKCAIFVFWGNKGHRECINRHYIDQKRNNIGLLRVRMPFCRKALSVRWVVLWSKMSKFRDSQFWDSWIGNAKIRGMVCAKVCSRCILGEQRAKRVHELTRYWSKKKQYWFVEGGDATLQTWTWSVDTSAFRAKVKFSSFDILGWLDCGCKDQRTGVCKSGWSLHFGGTKGREMV